MTAAEHELPLVSIIIPVYNAERYIGRCLDSAVGQTYKNLEIIVVDDGSVDRSPAICDEYAEKDNRITIIHKANGGLVSARKAGMKAASGEYASYLDDDDWIEANMYEELVREMVENCADIVTSGLYREYKGFAVAQHDNLSEGVYGLKEVKSKIVPACMHAGTFYKAGINIHLYNKLFRRELVLRNQLKVNDIVAWGEDAAVVYPCIMEAERIVITHKCFYHYGIRQNSNSMAWAGRQKGFHGYKAVYDVIKSAAEAYGPQKMMILEQLDYLMMYLLLIKEPQMLIREKKGMLFPFTNIRAGEKVVLYGGGRFGCSLHNFLLETGLCEVILWIDKSENPEKGIVSCAKLAEIADLQYDKIIISVLDGSMVDEIYEELLKVPIERNKIARVHGKITGNDFLGEIFR